MDRWCARLTDDVDARNFIQNEEKGRKESESGDGKFNGSGAHHRRRRRSDFVFDFVFRHFATGEKRANRRRVS